MTPRDRSANPRAAQTPTRWRRAVGFLRGDHFNVYMHPERIDLES
jgi:hypothetical protein